jgi:hypothetical protein
VGDDLTVRAAGGLLRWLLGALDRDVVEVTRGKLPLDFGLPRLPDAVRVDAWGGPQPHAQVRRGRPHDLGQLDLRRAVEHEAERGRG